MGCGSAETLKDALAEDEPGATKIGGNGKSEMMIA
jgi:hypothetical protein